jgi:hypothetical protein
MVRKTDTGKRFETLKRLYKFNKSKKNPVKKNRLGSAPVFCKEKDLNGFFMEKYD